MTRMTFAIMSQIATSKNANFQKSFFDDDGTYETIIHHCLVWWEVDWKSVGQNGVIVLILEQMLLHGKIKERFAYILASNLPGDFIDRNKYIISIL